MTRELGGVPPVEFVVTELAQALAADFSLNQNFGEHVAHTGRDFRQFRYVVEQTTEPPMRYEGFDVMETPGPQDEEIRERLHLPSDGRGIWLARDVALDGPALGAPDVIYSRGGHSPCYFWQDEGGKWETDGRNVEYAQWLGTLATKRAERVQLIDDLRAVGPAATLDYMRVMPPISVTVTNRDGDARTDEFNSDFLLELTNQNPRRYYLHDPVRHTLADVIESLQIEEGAQNIRAHRRSE